MEKKKAPFGVYAKIERIKFQWKNRKEHKTQPLCDQLHRITIECANRMEDVMNKNIHTEHIIYIDWAWLELAAAAQQHQQQQYRTKIQTNRKPNKQKEKEQKASNGTPNKRKSKRNPQNMHEKDEAGNKGNGRNESEQQQPLWEHWMSARA